MADRQFTIGDYATIAPDSGHPRAGKRGLLLRTPEQSPHCWGEPKGGLITWLKWDDGHYVSAVPVALLQFSGRVPGID